MMETETETSGVSFAQFLRVALDVLAARVFRWAALLMSFALFCVVMWRPDTYRLAAALSFTILCTLPLWWRKEK